MRPQDVSIQDPESLMYQILGLKEEIDHVASRLNEINEVFGPLSLRMPRFIPSELGFLRTVSWLFVMYYEVGKVNVDFLTERLSVYNLDPEYLFSWDEIPGNDNVRLIEIVKWSFNIDWVKIAKIEKIDDDKAIRLSNEKNYLLLMVNEDKTSINLRTDDGRTDKFIVKTENSKLRIYNKKLSKHLIIVQQLRTFLQHNLDPKERHNLVIQEACEQWQKQWCGTPIPGDERQWKICLIHLLNEAIDFFSALLTCIRCIEQDESRDQIIREWDFLRKRYHPPHEFDSLISKVAADMGREELDAARLRKRFYEEWVKELELLQGSYDFEIEARKLIEAVILYKLASVLPITGNDIIAEFNISPGPEVGQFLDRARKLYITQPCSREQLLKKLRLENAQ